MRSYIPREVVRMRNTMSIDEALEHFGIKGMHWGVRKSSDSSSSPKLTRKEVKAEKKAFYQNKAEKLFKTALDDPEVLDFIVRDTFKNRM